MLVIFILVAIVKSDFFPFSKQYALLSQICTGQSEIIHRNHFSCFISPPQYPPCTLYSYCAALAAAVLMRFGAQSWVTKQNSTSLVEFLLTFTWTPAGSGLTEGITSWTLSEMRFVWKVAGWPRSLGEGEGLSDPAGPLCRAAAAPNEELVELS